MAPEQLAHVLSPLQVGPVTLKNRIVSSAHLTHFARDHLPSDRHVYYYREKARGGLGLIVMEASAVHPTSAQFPTVVFAFDERVIPWYQRIAEAVHEEEAPVLAQLWHCGHHAAWNTTRQPLLAPSDVPCLYYRETPKIMEHEDIRTVVEAFRQSARNVRDGGLDGVEINGAHSYLLAQFMSPATNRRDDEYGGSLENRLRFALEVMEATREGLGDDRVLGIRLSADELIPAGYSLNEGVEIARRLVAGGRLDYLSVSVGVYPTLFMVMPPMAIPPGYQVYAADRVRQSLRQAGSHLPVSTVGRIKDVRMADKIVESGQADLVCMTRATIADPFLPKKAALGQLEDIRPCIACNQGCVGNAGRERHITCTVNAAAGYEETRGDGALAPAERRKRVAVIGGGPGGMEAARVAALRGHEVVLFEKGPELGGQVNIHARAPMRGEFKEITDYLARQMNKLGVDVRLNTEASEGDVLSLDADAVVVATGSVPGRSLDSPFRPAAVAESSEVLTMWEVLLEQREVGQRVLVVDEEGHHPAMNVAEFLADKGKSVEVITSLQHVANQLLLNLETPLLMTRLLSKGVALTPYTVVSGVNGRTVTLTGVAGGVERRVEVDTIVAVTGRRPVDDLYFALKGKVPELHRVGDCLAPRYTDQAIHEGHSVGRAV